MAAPTPPDAVTRQGSPIHMPSVGDDGLRPCPTSSDHRVLGPSRLSFVTLRSANEQLWLLTFAEVTRRHNEIVRDLPPEARSRDSDREGSGRQHARGSRGGANSSHEIEERVQSRTRRGRPRASRGAKGARHHLGAAGASRPCDVVGHASATGLRAVVSTLSSESPCAKRTCI